MKIIFGLVGGLAIFIYGMNMMSECLQKAAGEKMKKILALLTKNPILGVLAGALTTAVLQSSSATTVMTIGFVSAGLTHANALVDSREMVELKHELLTRRQKLRARMEYSVGSIHEMKGEALKNMSKLGNNAYQLEQIIRKIEAMNPVFK